MRRLKPIGLEFPSGPAAIHLALSCAAIALGGLLLGYQVDSTGAFSGTGYTTLGIGAVVALAATILQASRTSTLPRDPLAALAALCGFCGIAFLVSAVLAPGGTWMFFEVILLVVLLSRRHAKNDAPGPDVTPKIVGVLFAMLCFRLWITYQGSENRWQVMSLPVPVLSWIPFDFLKPVQSIELGEFTPQELGLPRAGLDFPASLALWASGFGLCAAGLLWRSRSAIEHENDRIHSTIQELPPDMARAVELILPEEQWHELRLHGLSERMLKKRLSALVGERVREKTNLAAAIDTAKRQARLEGEFAGEIQDALAERRQIEPGS